MTDSAPVDPTHRAPRRCSMEGELALEPSALGREYPPRGSILDWLLADEDLMPPYAITDEGVAVVSIQGPLEQRGGWWWDGHDAVGERITQALADTRVKAVVLRIDSPGGAVAGLFEAVGKARAAKEASGKPVIAHADENCYSAAYAWAMVADKVFLPVTGGVGSVGVLMVVYDRTKMTAEAGLNVQVVRSGSQKAEGHPDVPLTDAALSRMRARVNDLAAMFAGVVADGRKLDPAVILGLQGACLYGQDAVDKGLACGVGTLADSIATAAQMAADQGTQMDNSKAAAHMATLRALTGAQDEDSALATVAAWKTAHERAPELAAQIKALQGELDKGERERLFAEARRAGRWTPGLEAQAEVKAMTEGFDLKSLRVYLATLPAQVPTKAAHPAVSPEGSAELDETEERFAKAAGISLEAMRATKKKDLAAAHTPNARTTPREDE